MDQSPPENREYEALRLGAAIQRRPDHGALILRGADRLDFVQRMTTNDVVALGPGLSAVTVLTSPTARILFVFTALPWDDGLLLLPARGESVALARHLRSNIFFMDKVTVEDVSDGYQRLRVMGPQAGGRLAQAGFDLTNAHDGDWIDIDGVIVVKQERYDVPGYEVLIPTAVGDDPLARLMESGIIDLQDKRAYHARRVELGRPLPGFEATADYNPLEVGLAWTCSETKGCYTGQEIIARQITYDKVTRSLVGMCCDQLLEAGASLVDSEGKSVGVVTSAVFSLALAAPIALAIVKRPHNQPGVQLMAGDSPVTVVALPFEQSVENKPKL